MIFGSIFFFISLTPNDCRKLTNKLHNIPIIKISNTHVANTLQIYPFVLSSLQLSLFRGGLSFHRDTCPCVVHNESTGCMHNVRIADVCIKIYSHHDNNKHRHVQLYLSPYTHHIYFWRDRSATKGHQTCPGDPLCMLEILPRCNDGRRSMFIIEYHM